MKRLLLSLAFALTLAGSGSNGLERQQAHAQPATADVGGAETPADGAGGEAARAPDVSRGTQPAAGGATPAPAEAGDSKTATDSTGELLGQLRQLVQAGKWGAALVVVLLLIIAGLRTAVLGSWIPWLKTRIGGYVLAFLTAFGAVLSAAMAASVPISPGLLGAALWAGAGAIGLHQGQKDFREWWASRSD